MHAYYITVAVNTIPMPSFRWVWMTCKSAAEARRLARLVLEKRLAACANIFPVNSIFWWGGAVRSSNEVAVVLKTRESLEKRLISELEKAHSYDVPCIDSLAILGMNRSCASWLASQTRPAGSKKARKR
jgi:periplasmic divalent cation tolerance protein